MTKVLVADDERNVRLSLVYTLEDAGYDVIEAEDGSAALELALHERPEVILLDVWMPVIDGFGVLKRLRENPATQSIAVVLITGMSPEEGEQTAMDLAGCGKRARRTDVVGGASSSPTISVIS